ncbi:MAG: hypothetical protein AB7H66_06145 [Hyphomonadaceae bacterium]
MAPVLLGDLLALSRRSSADLSAWLDSADAEFKSRLQKEAKDRNESVAAFVRIAVADFLASADEEAWASLLSAMRDAADPGAACLARMAAFRLQLERTL